MRTENGAFIRLVLRPLDSLLIVVSADRLQPFEAISSSPAIPFLEFRSSQTIQHQKIHAQRRKKLFARTLYRANICRTISMEIASLQKFFPVPRLLARAAPPNL